MKSISVEEYRALSAKSGGRSRHWARGGTVASDKPKRAKYGNVKTRYKSSQGFERVYDSKAEARFAAELDIKLAARVIDWWLPQAPIPLPGGIRYVVDFILSNGRFIDVKGYDTALSAAKRKQVKALYGIDVEIVSGS